MRSRVNRPGYDMYWQNKQHFRYQAGSNLAITMLPTSKLAAGSAAAFSVTQQGLHKAHTQCNSKTCFAFRRRMQSCAKVLTVASVLAAACAAAWRCSFDSHFASYPLILSMAKPRRVISQEASSSKKPSKITLPLPLKTAF